MSRISILLLRTLAVFGALVLQVHAGFAFPLLRPGNMPLTQTLFQNSSDLTVGYQGIVSLGNCSGSLVRFEDSLASDKAMVLTNGHCVAILDPGEVRFNESISPKRFYILGESGSTVKTLRSTKLIYATMTRTDLALYELEASYEELSREGIPSFVLSSASPSVGTTIDIRSGYWRRSFSCAIEAIIPELREADWVMQESLRYSKEGCILFGGTSGSPVIDRETEEVIGVHNTGNESGRECTLNNPCEVDESGQISFEKDRNYGQQTAWLYTCRNGEGLLDLTQEGCKLPAP